MRKVRSFTLLILSLLMCIGSSVGQEHPPAPASQLPEQRLATVYVYRFDEGVVVANLFLWFKKTRPVYFSERLSAGPKPKNRKIAALRNKQYFMVRLPPGKYIFDTRLSDHAELDVAAGGEYYLRLDQGNDCGDEDPAMIGPPTCEDRSASIERVSPERWANDITALKPIKSGDVKDRGLVIIPSGTPSDNGMHPPSL